MVEHEAHRGLLFRRYCRAPLCVKPRFLPTKEMGLHLRTEVEQMVQCA